MPRSENYSTDSVQSFKSNFREHLSVALEGLSVCGATLFILYQLQPVFEHLPLRPTVPTRFATVPQERVAIP
jgi:hypothetical protein